jgi:uncharacterized protein (TIGR02271 family)
MNRDPMHDDMEGMTGSTWQDARPRYQTSWQRQYGSQGRWEDYEPYYQYGYEAFNRPEYRGLSWTEAEPRLRTEWTSRYPGRDWETGSTAVRDMWDEETRTLKLREEELAARKTSVETGRVRLGKEIVEEERTVDVPVTREEVYVERHPVERRPSDQPIGETETETIRVPVREEHVEVEKQPVVYEEVGVGKRVTQDTEHVSGTVRREELRVDKDGDVELTEGDKPR